MRRRRRILASLAGAAVVTAAGVLVLSGTGPAAADTNTVLAVAGRPGDIVVDGAHQRVLISDPEANRIIATDYAGNQVGTVGGLPGVTDLALSADSARLYAAVTGGDAIASISTAALKVTTTYPTGAGTKPASLAVEPDRIWFSYQDDVFANIGSLDLSGAQPAVSLHLDDTTRWAYPVTLVAGPGDRLAAANGPVSPVTIAMYDVSAGDLRQTAVADGGPVTVSKLVFTPDGSHLIAPSSTPEDALLKTSDLSRDGSWGTHQSSALAFAGDGSLADGGIGDSSRPEIDVYEPGATRPVRTLPVPDTEDAEGISLGVPELRSLAWEPGGTRLFALVRNGSTRASQPDTYSLRLIDEPGKSHTTIRIDAPAAADRAKPFRAFVLLSSSDPVPADVALTVRRTDSESPQGIALAAPTRDPDFGLWQIADSPPVGGPVTYTVSWAGDALHLPASGSATVQVSRDATVLTLDRNGKTYPYGSKQTFTAHLGSASANRTVEIWADPAGTDPKRLVRRAAVAASGNLTAAVTLTRNTTVSAVFAGDARSAPKSVASIVYTGVKVASALSRQTRTANIGSVPYARFKKKTNPLVTTTMTAYPGRRQYLVVQSYTTGAWRNVSAKYYALTPVALTGTHKTGVKMRVRAGYVRSGSGDTVNATTYGAWKYFIFS
jgi:hypothetical protein